MKADLALRVSPPQVPQGFDLKDSYFCLNKEHICNCADVCPKCGSTKLWPLANWLGLMEGKKCSGQG